MRAQGRPQETVLYGVEDLEDEWEGAFEIGSSSGEIAVGPNGVNILVIVRSVLLCTLAVNRFCPAHRAVHRCPLGLVFLPTTSRQVSTEIG